MTRTSARRERLAALAPCAALAALFAGAATPCGLRLAQAAVPGDSSKVRCLADGSGYFRARLRGALAADLDWRNASLECEGGMRPDGHGIRVSFAGPLRSAGAAHHLRFIFGIETSGEGRSGRALPANVTLIVEGERRIYSTRGDRECTVDALRQEPLGRDAHRREYRVAARGFCVGPATSLTESARVLVSRFDFAGRITLYDDAGPRAPEEQTTAAEVPSSRDASAWRDARRPLS